MRSTVRILCATVALMIVTVQAAAACSEPPEGFGNMTGGGWVDNPDLRQVHLGLALPCDPTRVPSLEINWEGHAFHLETMTTVSCTFTDPDDPQTGGTHEGTGIGRMNGDRALVKWRFVDSGNRRSAARPGDGVEARYTRTSSAPDSRQDFAEVQVAPVRSTDLPLSTSGPLLGGQIYMGRCVP